jgi:hypothetical protein
VEQTNLNFSINFSNNSFMQKSTNIFIKIQWYKRNTNDPMIIYIKNDMAKKQKIRDKRKLKQK